MIRAGSCCAMSIVASLLFACSSGPDSGSANDVAVSVAPPSAEVVAGGEARFAATVTGTGATEVTWGVVEAGGGAVDATGRYTAPSSPGVFHVRATSRTSPAAYGESTVTVVPRVAVTVSPRTPTVLAGSSITFTALVSNTAQTAVSWSVSPAGCGSVTQGGVYTAPQVPGVCAVVATSQADPTQSDAATVTVTPKPVVVTVTPSPATLDACGSVAFDAAVANAPDTSVTWSVQEGTAGGTITAAGLYTAPSIAGTYHVVATSNADATSSASVEVTVKDHVLSVVVTPEQVSVPSGGTAQLTATVTTTCGSFVSKRTIDAKGRVVAR